MNEIIQLKNGDLRIFNKVYEEFRKRLYRYVLNKTGSAFYAEEITQIAFIKLWNSREKLNEEIKLDIQIFRIARTTMIDHWRHISGYEKMQSLLSGKTQHSSDVNTGFDRLQEKEIRSKLKKSLSKLTPMQKKVFEMSRMDQLNYKEIASLQSISLKTVEHHIHEALKKIKGALIILILMRIF